jgi:hypothetical protein
MEGIAQALDALLRQGILPAAFIIGSIAFFIALIGTIPTGNGHNIAPIPRFFLGLFGFIFAAAGLGGTLYGIIAVTNSPSMDSGPRVVTATPMPQFTSAPVIASPTSIPSSPTIPSPIFIDTIEVLGSSNTGADFIVPNTGRYTFKFKSGGYCTYATDPGFATCLPTIWIFEGNVDFWQDDGRSLNQNAASRVIASISDCQAGNKAYCRTIADAEIQGRNSGEVRMNLTQGSKITLIGVDHREAYLDNPGQVLIDVYYLPE